MTALQMHLPALQVIVPMLSAPIVMLLREHRLSWMAATAASLTARPVFPSTSFITVLLTIYINRHCAGQV